MARSKSAENAARAEVDALLERQAATAAQIERLETAEGTLDVDGELARENELAQLRRAAQIIGRKLAEQGALLAEVQSEVDIVRLAALRRQEKEQAQNVADAVQGLSAEIHKLDGIGREILRLKQGGVTGYVNGTLRAGIDAQRAAWRWMAPELLGLPPKPSREEQARADALRDIERAEELLQAAQERRKQSRRRPSEDDGEGEFIYVGGSPLDHDNMIRKYEGYVERAKARARELGA